MYDGGVPAETFELPRRFPNPMTTTGYNGWRNYETWNVALWLQNDEGLYSLLRGASDYRDLCHQLIDLGLHRTPDGVDWIDADLDYDALEELVQEVQR
jgi:hypothetical protein